MSAEIETLCAEIPHDKLCIQWDVCIEMVFWDGQDYRGRTQRADVSKDEILSRMHRISAPVPHDVELGIHLCYGDFEAKHFIEPRDAGKMVELANALAKTIDHPLAFIHMPVPVERNDDGSFKPFENMQLDGKTEVYLGLVHAKDGAEGTRKHIATASKYVPRLGSPGMWHRSPPAHLVHCFGDCPSTREPTQPIAFRLGVLIVCRNHRSGSHADSTSDAAHRAQTGRPQKIGPRSAATR